MAQNAPAPIVPMLMPQPERMSVRSGGMPIGEWFAVSLTGYTEPRLQHAVERFYARITAQTGVPLIYGTRNQQMPGLVVHTQRAGEKIQTVGEDEFYRLEVTPQGARLEAVTPLGTLHGLETFLQLITPAPGTAFQKQTTEDTKEAQRSRRKTIRPSTLPGSADALDAANIPGGLILQRRILPWRNLSHAISRNRSEYAQHVGSRPRADIGALSYSKPS